MPPPDLGNAQKSKEGMHDLKRLSLREDSQENRPRKESALSRFGWKVVLQYSGKVVRHPCKIICFFCFCVGAVVGPGIIAKPFEIDYDFDSFIRADGHTMRQREAYLLAYGEKKGLSDNRRLRETSRRLDPGQRSAPFAAEDWWKAMRNFDDHATPEDEEMDEANGEIRLDEDRLEESEEEPMFFSTDGREARRPIPDDVFFCTFVATTIR